MHDRHGIIRGWLVFVIVLIGLITVFLIAWFIIRDQSIPATVTTTQIDLEEINDGVAGGFNWYRNDIPFLEFIYPTGWNLFEREFGNAQNIEKADIPLTGSDFDLSYFAQKDARIILDFPAKIFCQQTKNIKSWKAFKGDPNTIAVTDSRCTKPELLLINDYLCPAFADDAETTFRYGIFVPLKGGGGIAFNDTVPIPVDASVTVKGNTIETMKSKLREKANDFITQNPQLLKLP